MLTVAVIAFSVFFLTLLLKLSESKRCSRCGSVLTTTEEVSRVVDTFGDKPVAIYNYRTTCRWPWCGAVTMWEKRCTLESIEHRRNCEDAS